MGTANAKVKTLIQLCERSHVRLICESGGVQKDGDWEHKRYRVRLHRRPNHATGSFHYRQGMGIDHEPTVTDVLSALLSDARCGELPFEEFCAELGYDEDSRKVYSAWQQCQRASAELKQFFTGKLFDEFDAAASEE